MHYSLHTLHGRSCHQPSSPQSKQPAPCVRSWSSRERRAWSVITECAADAAAFLENSVAAAVDGLQAMSPQTAAGHAVVQAPHRQPVQTCSSVQLQKVADSLILQPLQHSLQQKQGPRQDHLYLRNAAQQQTASSPVQMALSTQHSQHRTPRHRGKRRTQTPATAVIASHDANIPVSKHHNVGASAAHSMTGRLQQQQAILAPCDRGGSLKLAAGMSRLLSQGQQVLLPAGEGMQIPRGLAALASARTLMLSANSTTGLVFQPSFSSIRPAPAKQVAAAAPVVAPGQRQSDGADEGQTSKGSNKSGKGSTQHSIILTASKVAEAQLRRHEQKPLIAARYGSTAKLAAAAVARVCQQGYTAVRASGPDAVRAALQAVTEARHKLLSSGLDIAVVPATEFVDVDSLPGQQEQQAVEQEADNSLGAGYGLEDSSSSSSSSSRQFVRVTVLHVMRCHLKQPWKLLPHRVPVEESPAAVWHNRQQQKHRRQQGVTGGQQDMMDMHQQSQQQKKMPRKQPPKPQHKAQVLQAVHQDQVSAQQLHVDVEQRHPQHHQQQHTHQEKQEGNRDQLLMLLRPTRAADQYNNTLLLDGGLASGSTVPLMPSPSTAGAVEGACKSLPKSLGVDVSGASSSNGSFSSGSSTDGSIWCQADDVGYPGVFVGEGMSCCDDADAEEQEVELMQVQAAATGHACQNQHPGQAMTSHQQRQGKSSRRQLVAAAQGRGQRATGGACNGSST